MTTRRATTLTVLLTLLLVLPAGAYPAPGRTTLLSVTATGAQQVDASGSPVVSADGTAVVFSSFAALVPEDTNRVVDYYVRDLAADTIERVSVATDGGQISSESASASRQAAISADGRIVAFESGAPDLVAGDTNGVDDVFVHDRETGETIRISESATGAQSAWESKAPAISGDGRYAFFLAEDDTLVEGDRSPYEDIFRRDLETGSLELVTTDAQSNQSVFDPNSFSVSHDGEVLAFAAISPTYVAPDANGPVMDVFVKDLRAGTVELISRAPGGAPATGNSLAPSISADGRYVAFASLAGNLVPDDRNPWVDVYVHDRATGRIRQVSVKSSGDASSLPAGAPRISADGRFVTFNGADTLADIEERNGGTDAWVHDLWTDTAVLASAGPSGASGNDLSINPTISGDGRLVAFSSASNDLVPADENDHSDAFLREVGPAFGIGGLTVDGDGRGAGWARFAGSVVESADPATDGTVQVRALGGEIIFGRVVWRPEQDDLFVRVDLDSLPSLPQPETVLGVPGIRYTVGFKLDGVSHRVRVDPAAGSRPPVVLQRCAASCSDIATLPGGLGVAGVSLTTSIPVALLGASPGSRITDLQASTTFSQVGASSSGDTLSLGDLTLDAARVELGTAPAGEEPAAYPVEAALDGGWFSAPLGAIPAGHAVWARACIGAVCATPIQA